MDFRTLEQTARREPAEFAADREHRRFVVILAVGLAVILIGVGLLTYRIVTVSAADKARFMSQCMQDHKEYECTYLWRSSERPGPDVIPIPIPIPTR